MWFGQATSSKALNSQIQQGFTNIVALTLDNLNNWTITKRVGSNRDRHTRAMKTLDLSKIQVSFENNYGLQLCTIM